MARENASSSLLTAYLRGIRRFVPGLSSGLGIFFFLKDLGVLFG